MIYIFMDFNTHVNETVGQLHRSNAMAIPTNFVNYVFDFKPENRNQLLNLIQYTLIAFLPVILTLRLIKYTIPVDTDSKTTIEIALEVIAEVILIVLAIWFTNRIIQYIPTYSGAAYPTNNGVGFIVPFVIILSTLQTKLGAKLNILIDRVSRMIKSEPFVGNSSSDNNGGSSGGSGMNSGNMGGSGNSGNMGNMGGGISQPIQPDYRDIAQLIPSNPAFSSMPTKYSSDNNNSNSGNGNGRAFERGSGNSGNSSNNSNNMGGNGQELGEPMAANDGGWSSSGQW